MEPCNRSLDRTTSTTSPPRVKLAAPRAIVLALALATPLGIGAMPAGATGQPGSLDVVSRPEGRVLPVYAKDGRRWIVGTPGREYALRVCNATGVRLLAVMSVDGVNVISGETASPAQSGYVLGAHTCADINGWRKNLASTAAFYFTELPDAYAARTGRPENVGVIGVAFFRERQQIGWRNAPGKFAASPAEPAGPAARAEAAQDSAAAGAPASRNDTAARERAAAPMAKVGTGHGRREWSYVQTTTFERESETPDATVAIHYDRRENLVAMGILPAPSLAGSPDPFPAWAPRFTPDPPAR